MQSPSFIDYTIYTKISYLSIGEMRISNALDSYLQRLRCLSSYIVTREEVLLRSYSVTPFRWYSLLKNPQVWEVLPASTTILDRPKSGRCPIGGSEECQWQEFSQLLSSVVLSSANDRCSWSLNGNDVFSVKSAREVIDKHINSRLESTYPTETKRHLIHSLAHGIAIDAKDNGDHSMAIGHSVGDTQTVRALFNLCSWDTSKANVAADAQSGKERLRPSRVRPFMMLAKTSLKSRILDARGEAMKQGKNF
ncbi:hypothetical protein Tco_0923365 [Tanacetum coccineum]|uniref:Uncharacterized protein n=1 Tax=Tanacetum coccineum TaxID=301880 RepID=A0ABQ5D0T3_9ASTR